MPRIRVARPDELPFLRELEVAAGRIFADFGMPEVAGDEALPLEDLAAYQRDGRALVVTDDDGIIAYALIDPVDECVHIEQISVHPRAARQGIGKALIEHIAANAVTRALTLTTFRDVPWNAPHYERCGFRTLAADEITPGLRRIRMHEAELGLDRWPRVCMRRGPDA
ncbi:MAG TPA: GNAT family N-acetyltransferase [Micromonosporaceae bacterium]|jgi:GNAT superfamily N-acetyltransferase